MLAHEDDPSPELHKDMQHTKPRICFVRSGFAQSGKRKLESMKAQAKQHLQNHRAKPYLMIEVIKEGLIDDSRQGGPNAACPHALLHNYDMAGLANALCDGLHVEGLQADQVNHLQPATTALSM